MTLSGCWKLKAIPYPYVLFQKWFFKISNDNLPTVTPFLWQTLKPGAMPPQCLSLR